MVAIVDCNNFYASCERLFNPSLENRPVVVLSNNDGCVIARSNEAKAMGIKMGAPAFMMEELMERHNVAVFSSNYTLYGDMSNRVMQALAAFAPRIELYSIDEAFVDLTGVTEDLFLLGNRIRTVVTAGVGIPVSIGIAPTKTLAKMANQVAKKNGEGVYLVKTHHDITALLGQTSVADIWGVGGQLQKLLLQQKIVTAADLVKLPDDWVRKHMTVKGLRLVHELRGIPCLEWEDVPSPKKGITTARSFGQLLSSKEEIRQALANYANTCARKLRLEKSCAAALQIFLQTNTHRVQDPQYLRSINIRLEVPSNHAQAIMQAALKGLDIIYREGYKFKKVGITVLELTAAANIQMGMFDNTDRRKNGKLMDVFDNVNATFGKDIIRYAGQGFSKKWRLRQLRLSPSYTTRLSDIPVVQC